MRTIRNICLLAALLMSYTAISPIATAGYSVAVLIPTVTGTAVKNVTIRGSKALIKVSKDGSVRVMDDVSDDVMKAFLRDNEAAFTKETYDALQTKTGRELKEGIYIVPAIFLKYKKDGERQAKEAANQIENLSKSIIKASQFETGRYFEN